jgi:hypothetical protein
MGRKEILSLAAGIGFFIIWIIDLNSPVPNNIKGHFWSEIFYHYGWLMYCVACLFYYQYSKNERLKKEDPQKSKKK